MNLADQIKEAQAVLLGQGAPLKQHYELQSGLAGPVYEATVVKLLDNGVDLPASTKAKALAAAFGRADTSFARRLLSFKTFFGLPEVLKAALLLDTPRQTRQLRKQLETRQASHEARCRRMGEVAGLKAEEGEVFPEDFINSVDKVLNTGVCKQFKRFSKINKILSKQAADNKTATSKPAQLKRKRGTVARLRKAPPNKATQKAEPAKAPKVIQQPKKLDSKLRKKLQGAVKRAKLQFKTIAALQHEIKCLEHALPPAELPEGAHVGVSGATAKHIRRWIRSQPKEELAKHVLMDMPRDNWARLADLVHPSPADFALPWFLQWVHMQPGSLPEVTQPCAVLQQLAKLQAVERPEQLGALLFEGVEVEYSFIRRKFPWHQLSMEARSMIARYASVTQLIWHLDDGLDGLPVLKRIVERLEQGDAVELPFGKLVERMLMIQKQYGELMSAADGSHGDAKERATVARLIQLLEGIASKRLAQINLNLPPPVLVLGDASASMQVCVETSAIVGCMLAAITSADLTFFQNNAWSLPTPQGVPEVLKMAVEVQADCCTSPAAGLVQAYTEKKKYSTILIITDEEENTPAEVRWHGGRRVRQAMFAELLARYKAEVSPDVQVVFVSFLSRIDSTGYMVERLREVEIEAKQFKMDQRRPDLTKLDNIFAIMATNSPQFVKSVEATAVEIADRRMAHAVGGEILRPRVASMQLDEGSQAPEGLQDAWEMVEMDGPAVVAK